MARFVAALCASFVLVATAIVALAPGARPAHACSIVTPTDDRFGDWVERSPVVAIGRWEAVDAREVTFVVEQPLKGVEPGDRLLVDNRGTYTAFACSPYDETFHGGDRFEPGTRAILLLEKEVEGLWQVAYLSLAAFEVPETVDAPLEGIGWYFGNPEAGTPTDIKLSTIIRAAGYEGAVSLEPPSPGSGIVPSGPGWSPFPGPASRQVVAGGDDDPGWLGLALGTVLFAAPIAWRWRT